MAKREKRGSWVVMGGASNGDIVTCNRCGDVLRINLPQHMKVLLAAVKAFGGIHSWCEQGEGVDASKDAERKGD